MWATPFTEIFIPLEGVIDLGEQVKRLEKELAKAKGDVQRSEAKLQNQNFVSSAPPEVIEEAKKTLVESKEKVDSLERNLLSFK